MGQEIRNPFRIMEHYSKLRTKALRIKEDETKRDKSYHFGMTSIWTSLFGIAFCLLGAWIFQAFQNLELVAFAIIFGIGFILFGIVLFAWALLRLIFQFIINRNWSSWVSLIIFFLGLITSLAGILFLMLI